MPMQRSSPASLVLAAQFYDHGSITFTCTPACVSADKTAEDACQIEARREQLQRLIVILAVSDSSAIALFPKHFGKHLLLKGWKGGDTPCDTLWQHRP